MLQTFFEDERTLEGKRLTTAPLLRNENLKRKSMSEAHGEVSCHFHISRESIFTGLNDLKILSVLNQKYAKQFGFTQPETDKMLCYYGLESKSEKVKKWYDGYFFGPKELYNPWNILNYVDNAQAKQNVFPKPYWSNISSNNIVWEPVECADKSVRKEIEDLIAGKAINYPGLIRN